jgi:hypothetical protein
LSVLLSFGHWFVCSSVFWPLICLFFCLLAIDLSVLLRYTDSDYPFGIFKLFLLSLWLYCSQNFKRFGFPIFRFESTWCMLFQKRAVRTKCIMYADYAFLLLL